MTSQITSEHREALRRSEGFVAIEDSETRRRYFLVDASTFEKLRRREDIAAIQEGIAAIQDGIAAIQDGIAEMEAGRASPLEEVIARIRSNLGL